MQPAHVIAGSLLAGVGGLAVATAWSQRRVAAEAAEWLDAELSSDAAAFADIAPPIDSMTVTDIGMAGLRRAGAHSANNTPAAVLDRLHEQLLQAGLTTTIRAEEFLAVNII